MNYSLLIFMNISAEMVRAIVEYIIGVIAVKMYVVRFTVSLNSLIDSDAPYSG